MNNRPVAAAAAREQVIHRELEVVPGGFERGDGQLV